MVTTNLFRRQILRSSHHDVFAGEVFIAIKCFGDSEVGQHDALGRIDQNVSGLDIAMDQALLVCCLECRAHRVTNAEDTIDTESLFAIESLT